MHLLQVSVHCFGTESDTFFFFSGDILIYYCCVALLLHLSLIFILFSFGTLKHIFSESVTHGSSPLPTVPFFVLHQHNNVERGFPARNFGWLPSNIAMPHPNVVAPSNLIFYFLLSSLFSNIFGKVQQLWIQ